VLCCWAHVAARVLEHHCVLGVPMDRCCLRSLSSDRYESRG
jgi:hypothetical protein